MFSKATDLSNGALEQVLVWLLEEDPLNPGVRYFTLRDLMNRPENDDELVEAKRDIMRNGPVPVILDSQHPDGYWAKPGGGYSPSYTVSLWQVIFLGELGADGRDKRVQRGCNYLLDHIVATNGGFAMDPRPVPSSVVHCLNGEPLHALIRLGFYDDPRVQKALDWQVKAIIADPDVRYYKSGTCAKGFACGYNQRQPCAWGATKALKALSVIPIQDRTPKVKKAIDMGGEFLMSSDLASADYPYTEKINTSWFKFGFPLSYRSDVLETMNVLARLGYGVDPRLNNARQFISGKRDDQGRWMMEKSLNGKMWIDIEEKGKPSKWITLQALCALGH